MRAAASAIGTGVTVAKGGNTLADAATNAASITDAGRIGVLRLFDLLALPMTNEATLGAVMPAAKIPKMNLRRFGSSFCTTASGN